jgi:exosortase C (VPDSG-CTERM-specific)
MLQIHSTRGMGPELHANEPAGLRPATGHIPTCPANRRAFVLYLALLSICFFKPLLDLIKFAHNIELYSHIFLVPFVTGYLLWLNRKKGSAPAVTSPGLSGIFASAGAVLILGYWILRWNGWKPLLPDYLCVAIASFVCFILAGVAFFWGKERFRALLFPLLFLFFMAPLPDLVTGWIEIFFQYTSAEAASLLFGISQSPVLRDGLVFQLPGIVIEVAHECSGIRSSLVLFLTSLIGGYIFFRSKSHRAILALSIIPLAILRNGFRIFVIAMLCVYVDPNLIHSPIHKRGGPLFFLLSLIPFFALLLFFYRRERNKAKPPTPDRSDLEPPSPAPSAPSVKAAQGSHERLSRFS